MRWLGLCSLIAFLLTSGGIGVRLLSLARRTRELPELAIGSGLVLIAVVGFPLSAVGRLPRLVSTPLGDGLLAVGLLAACAGIGLLYVFTWIVFRADSPWARRAVAGAWLALLVTALGLLLASKRAATLPEILPHTRPWAAGIIAAVAVAFAWSGVESALYHRKLRRRLPLGLADPVVANRFLLWSLSGASTTGLCAVLIGLLFAGRALLLDPVAVATVAVTGFGAALAWYLAFLPPRRYLDFVRGRPRASHP